VEGNQENPPLEGNDWLVHIEEMMEKDSLLPYLFTIRKRVESIRITPEP
jgi:hypothetical protein